MRRRRGRLCRWHRLFRERGYRITGPRQCILQVLVESEEHLSAEEIFVKVHQLYPDIGLATVYRTLDLLTQMGLVWKLDLGDGKARYEIVKGPHKKKQHFHCVCTRCGKVIDYEGFSREEAALLRKVKSTLADRYGFGVTSHSLRLYGICQDCRKKG